MVRARKEKSAREFDGRDRGEVPCQEGVEDLDRASMGFSVMVSR